MGKRREIDTARAAADEMPAVAGRLRHLGMLLLRLVLTALILIVVLRQVDTALLLRHLQRSAPLPLLGAMLVCLASRLAIAVKWKMLLNHEGIDLGFVRVCRILFLSSFFGMILPGGVGADALRLASLRRGQHSLARGAGTILVDRLLNMLVMAAFSAAGVRWVWPRLASRSVGVVVLGLSLLAIGLVAGVMWRRSFQAFRGLSVAMLGLACRPGSRLDALGHRLLSKLEKVHVSVQGQLGGRALMMRIVPLAIVGTLLRVVMVDLVFRSLGVPVAWWDELAFVPMAQMLGMLPITVLGLGITEGAFAYFFAAVGVSPVSAVGASLLTHVVGLLVITAGALLFLVGGPLIEARPRQRRDRPVTDEPAREPSSTA